MLHEWASGDRSALPLLVEQVYPELRRIAARHLRGERPGHTLQPRQRRGGVRNLRGALRLHGILSPMDNPPMVNAEPNFTCVEGYLAPAAFVRVMTPESSVTPLSLIVWKCMVSPSISTSMNA